MEKIKRYIDCKVPTYRCNLKCSYCYLGQYGVDLAREAEENEYKYDAKTIRKALSRDRLGGVCYLMIVGEGETLVDAEVIDIADELLAEGHVIDLVTNGTMTKRFQELFDMIDPAYYGRLKFTFSLHYLEFKRLNLLDTFFDNIRLAKEKGTSFHVILNHCDEYLPYTEEIQKLCEEKVGAYPQLAYTHETGEDGKLRTCSRLSPREYYDAGSSYKSDMFDYQSRTWEKKQTEFCYAGDWSFTLNLGTGIMSKCHSNGPWINIFDDVNKEIPFEAVGKNCASSMCQCTRFLAMGVAPGVCDDYTVERTMNRRVAGWFTKEMQYLLSTKLYETNQRYDDKNV